MIMVCGIICGKLCGKKNLGIKNSEPHDSRTRGPVAPAILI